MSARKKRLSKSFLAAISLIIPTVLACEMRESKRMEINKQEEKIVLMSAPFGNQTALTTVALSRSDEPNDYFVKLNWEAKLPKDGVLYRQKLGEEISTSQKVKEGATEFYDDSVKAGESYVYELYSDSRSSAASQIVVPLDLDVNPDMKVIPKKGRFARIIFRDKTRISIPDSIQWKAEELIIKGTGSLTFLVQTMGERELPPPEAFIRVQRASGNLRVYAQTLESADPRFEPNYLHEPVEAYFYLSVRHPKHFEVTGNRHLISACTSLGGVRGRDWDKQCDYMEANFDKWLNETTPPPKPDASRR